VSHQPGNHKAIDGQELLYGGAVATLTGALTSLSGSDPMVAAAAGLAGFALPMGLRHVLPLFQRSSSIFEHKMLLDFENHVLSYPLQAREAKRDMISAVGQAGLRGASISDEDFLPECSECWYGAPPPGASEKLRARPIRISCSCTSPGFIAAFETMRQLWGLPVTEDFHTASSLQQIQDIQSGRDEYDFLIVGAFSFMFRAGSMNKYRILFPGTIDHQYLLTRRETQRADWGATSIVPWRTNSFDTVYFIPETANEMLVRQLTAQSHLRARDMSVADIRGVGSSLRPGEVVTAWDPNAQILMRQHGLEPVAGGGMAIPICVAAHNRYFSKREKAHNYQSVRAFCAIFIAAWNLCKRNPEAAYERLLQVPLLTTSFGAGLGLVGSERGKI
jgi:hypothetical protein